jgi:5'(3')-deoxyribonucleotidase
MAPRKELLAVESAVLIDDNEDNIEKFVSAGGSGVLWPRRWNKGDESRSIQDLLKEVERHLL